MEEKNKLIREFLEMMQSKFPGDTTLILNVEDRKGINIACVKPIHPDYLKQLWMHLLTAK